jgi:[glutamine synthetase] adenylyltransferase / [glutamine synthetase]-adenylyl-L-tyrosine phosphorylase
LRDILGLADFEQNLAELSALADACLQYALEVVLRKNKIKSPPFAIVGLGKLGGQEISYGSDLDVLFIAGSKEKNLPRLQKLAAEILDLLSRRTEQGIVFQTDARLRPDGEKGLLVQTFDACENYYRRRAQLWEIQMLTRARFVAGNSALGEKFEKLAGALSNFSNRQSAIGNRQPKNWKKQIHQMRLRIERARTPGGQDNLAIKTGKGGLMDAEFIAQVLCMENGWREPNTLRALKCARENKILPDAEKLIENYRQLRRVEGILRRWSYEGETVLPDDAPAFYRVSVRCGFESPEKFRIALADWRRAIREVYENFLR